MPIRKISDDEGYNKFWKSYACMHPDHEVPSMISLPPGTYEHECAGCHRIKKFVVHGTRL